MRELVWRVSAKERQIPAVEVEQKLDINILLHQSRSAFLRRMPPGARVLCSAGCAGNWYFEWVERCYGRVEKHIGLENKLPKLKKLPENVE